MPKNEKKQKTADSVISPDITEAELDELFNRYLGPSTHTSETVGYDDVYRKLLDAQGRSGMPATDVEKNINEAEKYVDALAGRTHKEMTFRDDLMDEVTGSYGVEIQNTEQLAAFAPDTGKDDSLSGETRVIELHESADPPEPEFPTDTAMMRAFGLSPKTSEFMRDERLFDARDDSMTREIPQAEHEKTEANEDEQVPPQAKKTFEYTDPLQNREIMLAFKSKYNFAKARLVMAGVLVILLGLLENIPGISTLLGGTVNVVLVDWVLTVAAATLVFDRIALAAKALTRFAFDFDTITLAAFVLSFVATGASIFLSTAYSGIFLYNFPFAICVFLNLFSLFSDLRRDVYTFKIVSSAKTKKVLARPSEGERTPETVEFSEYLGENEHICTIKKSEFISDYFAKRSEKASDKLLMKLFVPICFLMSVILFFISFFVMKQGATQSLGMAYAVFMMSAPFTAFITYSYPHYLASRCAYTYNAAIVGDTAHEAYTKTAVIAFRDEEAFPAELTKVKGLKLFGDRKIENVMYYASSVYSKLGGPLATVFKQATLNSVVSRDIEIREVSREGVSAMVDGKNVVLGSPAYMEEQCFEIAPAPGDEKCGGKSNRRILYLACDEVVIAKFHVQYTATSDFLYMIDRLMKAGVGVSIRTADPCIDDGLLYTNKMNPEKYPVKVVKGVLSEEKTDTISAKDAGILSVGTEKELIKTFLLCDKIENVKKTNFVLETVASVFGIAVMALVLITGNAEGLHSIFPALYQLFWLIPICVISRIYI